MERWMTVLLVAAMLTAGCVSALDEDEPSPDDPAPERTEITRVQDRHALNFTIDEGPSHTLRNGSYEILDGVGVRVNVPLPATEGGGAATGSAEMSLGLFLPDIPGCDWGMAAEDGSLVPVDGTLGNQDLAPECQVPVVADVGPYYSTSADQAPLTGGQGGTQMEGDTVATEPAERLGGFLIRQLVPHGYAVAQVSVYGTGDSGHCMDLMGLSEQSGIDGAVTWLGEQAWSNGNVGLIGRSYDGTTPWEAAAQGNEHLKTIAPISGLIGLHDLMWRNGSAESRGGTGLLYGIYQTFAFDGSPEDLEAASCPDVYQGLPQSVAAWVTGDQVAPQANPWWAERSGFLERALENYNGSVYLIHGLQDWNVDPHQAFPTFQRLQDAGIETKGLFGQWDHAYPDRVSNHEDLSRGYGAEAFPATVRHDWAQDLLEWFDHYLKGTGEQPQLHAEVQGNQGYWRIHSTYPPAEAQPTELTLANASYDALTEMPIVREGDNVTFTFDPLSQDQVTRITGLPTFHVRVTPTGPGGQLFAQLRDAETGLRLGHAIMDLRYHQGGDEMQTVTPGQTITARMQFQAMDVELPAGHGLELILATTGEDYLPPSTDDPIVVLPSQESVLTLPLLEPTAEAFFLPPGLEEQLGDGVPEDVPR